ncbi:MAG: ATP-grasp domain-containing protein [Candidatus Methylomirabilales bacterium]
MSVLVTPGNLRSALAVTRSLGRRGVAVTIADERQRSMAGASRYCRASIRIPAPAMEPDGFITEICQAVSRVGHRVVIPTDDVTLCLLAEARSRFEGLAAFPFPGIEAIQMAHDKATLGSLAEELDIPTPKTVVINEPADLAKAFDQIGFPAVVKPRHSRFRCGGEWVHGGRTVYVHTAEELRAACQAIPFPLIQEYVPGEGRGVFLLLSRGNLRAAFAHRRIREKPPSGGVSVLSESVALDPPLVEYSHRLLEALKWHGVAMVEFKQDARTMTAKMLEINGRFWGSLQLAVDAGVDFPYLLYQLAVEGDVAPVFAYQEGVRLRWWLGDLDWLFLRLRDGEQGKSRLGALREFLGPSPKRACGEVFRWDDPAPAFEELSGYVGHTLRATARRLRSRPGYA